MLKWLLAASVFVILLCPGRSGFLHGQLSCDHLCRERPEFIYVAGANFTFFRYDFATCDHCVNSGGCLDRSDANTLDDCSTDATIRNAWTEYSEGNQTCSVNNGLAEGVVIGGYIQGPIGVTWWNCPSNHQ